MYKATFSSCQSTTCLPDQDFSTSQAVGPREHRISVKMYTGILISGRRFSLLESIGWPSCQTNPCGNFFSPVALCNLPPQNMTAKHLSPGRDSKADVSSVSPSSKRIEGLTNRRALLRRRANARNVGFRMSLRWPIYIVNSVDKTKLSCNTPTDATPQFL